MTSVLSIVRISGLVVTVLVAGTVCSQDFPIKTIRIVTSTPGGGNDFSARLIAQNLAGNVGQSVIVDNRAGIIGMETVAKARPDGYSMLLQSDTFWTLPFFQAVSYDPIKDFLPVSLTGRTPTILVVHPSVAAHSVKELIALAKSKPGELNYGNAALGSATHLAAEIFKSMAGVNLVSVLYKGSGGAIIDLLGGNLQVMFAVASSVTQHVKAGKLRGLAVSTAEPSAFAPGMPTIAASGLPGFQAASTQGLWVPAKTPEAIINRLNQEIIRAISKPDVKEKFFASGVEIVGSTPAQFAAHINADTAFVQKLMKGVQPAR
jgi:tripartite-type tricarboxylate transporter receptor subunit TctC